MAEHELQPVPAERRHRLRGVTAEQCVGHAFCHVDVLIVTGRYTVEELGERRIPPVKHTTALGSKERVPAVHRHIPAAAVLLEEETFAEAFFKQDAAAGFAVEFAGESA